MSVCVLGSANLDLVVVVEEAPARGETVTGQEFLQVPGGKGANQAVAAARAGAAVAMIGAVGRDPFGAQVRAVLEEAGVDTRALAAVDEPTGTAHVVVEHSGANSIVVVPGANGTLTSLTAAHRQQIAGSDLLLLQLELPLGVVLEAAEWARRSGTRVVLTPAPVAELPDELLVAVDLLVPNEHEAARLTGESDVEGAARVLLGRGVGSVVVTLGEQGCLALDQHGTATRVSAPSVEAVDTTGAGDTFVGCLAAALVESRPLADALPWATMAASLSVRTSGASSSMPSRTQIDAACAAAGEPS